MHRFSIQNFYLIPALLLGLFWPDMVPPENDVPLFILPILFSFCVLGMVLVIGVQAYNPLSAKKWEYPSLSANSSSIQQPIQLFFSSGMLFLALAVGVLARHLLFLRHFGPDSVFLLVMSIGILLGVWICTKLFRKKMKQ